jgi:hypothetical protein
MASDGRIVDVSDIGTLACGAMVSDGRGCLAVWNGLGTLHAPAIDANGIAVMSEYPFETVLLDCFGAGCPLIVVLQTPSDDSVIKAVEPGDQVLGVSFCSTIGFPLTEK